MQITQLKKILAENNIGADWLQEELDDCLANDYDSVYWTLSSGEKLILTVAQMQELLK